MENINIDDLNVDDIKNIKISWNPSLEEKIDYIYKTLKTDKRNRRIKTFIKVLLLIVLVYGVYIYLPSLATDKKDEYKEKFTNFLSKNISELVWPIVQNVVQDTVKNMNVWWENISIPTEIIWTWTSLNEEELNKELQRKMEILKKMQNK